jgi:hypothetical protein
LIDREKIKEIKRIAFDAIKEYGCSEGAGPHLLNLSFRWLYLFSTGCIRNGGII